MKLLKSRKGFTLIELLVVIGILAVLAAIAIPSVAGLIDRANVSADKTNANEMTNAVERFTSEYELYCQDIASGAIKDADNNGTPDDMDAAQGRVFNVTGAITRANITSLEVAQGTTVADDARAIYRDTKYPANAATMRAIVENYTKTSSTTFEPKQSDMHYWYSPDCGVVVYATPDADVVEDLNSQIQSGMDAKGNPLGDSTKWIDLTAPTDGVGSNGGGNASLDMSTVDPVLANNDWATIKKVIQEGKVTEAGWRVGDKSPTFTINNKTNMEAILVDVDSNKATFILTTSIGSHRMTAPSTDYPYGDNINGYTDTEVKAWLDGEVYNGLDADLKAAISSTNIICAAGGNNPNGTKTADCYLFLPSIKEVGLNSFISDWYDFMATIEAEGETFDWFANGEQIDDWFWLRSPYAYAESDFFIYDCGGNGNFNAKDDEVPVCPAFVIG